MSTSPCVLNYIKGVDIMVCLAVCEIKYRATARPKLNTLITILVCIHHVLAANLCFAALALFEQINFLTSKAAALDLEPDDNLILVSAHILLLPSPQ